MAKAKDRLCLTCLIAWGVITVVVMIPCLPIIYVLDTKTARHD